VGSNPLRACFFNLILAKCGMYVRGGKNRKDRIGNGENELCGKRGMGMAEHGMTAYPLLP
jgi:hypothetical protein